MSTNNRPARKRAPKRPMIADLAGYHTAEAVEVAQTLLDEDGAYPGPVDAAAAALTRVGEWAVRHRVEQLGDLTGARAEQLLLDVTGAGSLHPMDPVAADALHLHRNTVSMLRLMVLLTRPSTASRRSDRPGQDTIAAGLPEIGPRTGYRVRSLRDDEIALGRLLVALDLEEKAPLLPLHNYVLSEAGIVPMEITAAATSELTWDDQVPVRITVRGVHQRGRRPVDFDDWQRHILGITVPAHQRSGRPYLAYAGAAPNTKEACASTSPTLVRFLRRAGITGRDVSTGSVALWRADHTLRHQRDLGAAANTTGTTPELLLKNLHYAVEELNIHRGVATLVTLDARPDVHVPAGQVRGLGRWTDDEHNPGTLRPAA
jgi:hypothetical protein